LAKKNILTAPEKNYLSNLTKGQRSETVYIVDNSVSFNIALPNSSHPTVTVKKPRYWAVDRMNCIFSFNKHNYIIYFFHFWLAAGARCQCDLR